MNVTVQKTLDVECECDVTLDDILRELDVYVEEGRELPNRLIGALDYLTRILGGVTDVCIAAMPHKCRIAIANRLRCELERYERKDGAK